MHWHCDQKCLWPITCINIKELPALLRVIAVLWGINAFRSNFAVRHDERDLVLLLNVFWDIYSVISALQVLNTNGSVRGNNCDVGTRAPNLQMDWKSKINMNSDLCGFLTIPTETKDILACSKIIFENLELFWPITNCQFLQLLSISHLGSDERALVGYLSSPIHSFLWSFRNLRCTWESTNMILCWSINLHKSIPDICHFFTCAKLENKIYTEKTRKLRQNTQ